MHSVYTFYIFSYIKLCFKVPQACPAAVISCCSPEWQKE